MHRIHQYPGSFLPGMELAQCAIARAGLICLVVSLMLVSVLAGGSAAQISVTSPVSGATVPMPVWIRAHVAGCNGSTATAIGWTIDDSPFTTWGVTAFDIDTNDYRWSSPGTYTIHFKAWSGSIRCSCGQQHRNGERADHAQCAKRTGELGLALDLRHRDATRHGKRIHSVSCRQSFLRQPLALVLYELRINGGGMLGSTWFLERHFGNPFCL